MFKRTLTQVRGPLCALLASVIALAPVQPVLAQITEEFAPATPTATPIQHLIVIVGENHTFDNIFATYQPKLGQTVWNLLSQKIVRADGTPGANFSRAAQQQATDTTIYSINPSRTGPYAVLPQPNTTYAYGEPLDVPDDRFPADLPPGPFQITKYVPYQLGFTGDPVHRFFQMWQQVDNGKNDLFTWVAQTVGIGPQNSPPVPGPADTFQGGVAMGFVNMSTGDAPVFKFIADNYAISDNYHQGIMGGTGANFIYLGTGDAAFFSDGFGSPRTRPPTRSKIPTRRPGPITSTYKMAMGAAPMSTATIRANPGCSLSSGICRC